MAKKKTLFTSKEKTKDIEQKLAGEFGDMMKMKGAPSMSEVIKLYRRYRSQGSSASDAMKLIKTDIGGLFLPEASS